MPSREIEVLALIQVTITEHNRSILPRAMCSRIKGNAPKVLHHYNPLNHQVPDPGKRRIGNMTNFTFILSFEVQSKKHSNHGETILLLCDRTLNVPIDEHSEVAILPESLCAMFWRVLLPIVVPRRSLKATVCL